MTPAKEVAVRANVKEALFKLASGNSFTRNDLFGKGTPGEVERTYRLLKRLADQDLIISGRTSDKPGEQLLHQAKNAAKLTAIANDDVELSRLIWPGRTPGGPLELVSQSVESVPSTPEATSVEPSLEEKIDAILKICMALVDNVLHLHKKIDGINTQKTSAEGS